MENLPADFDCNGYREFNPELKDLTDEILKNRESILYWTIDIHNLVNKELNKKIYDRNEALQLIYSNFSSSPIKPTLDMNLDMSY